MNKKRIFLYCCIFIAVIFGCFYIGKSTISQTSETSEIQKFSVFGKCADGQKITTKTNNTENIQYFSQCFCMISNQENPEPVWLDIENIKHTEFIDNDSNKAVAKCNTGCDDLCKSQFNEFLSKNPDFKIVKRW